jgi:hypothetical protein
MSSALNVSPNDEIFKIDNLRTETIASLVVVHDWQNVSLGEC